MVNIFASRAESRMDKRSSMDRAGEWRKQCLSGQIFCGSSIGADSGEDGVEQQVKQAAENTGQSV
jgi:hypothetical protein